MKLRLVLAWLAVALTAEAHAADYRDLEPLKLETPEMTVGLGRLPGQPAVRLCTALPEASPKMDFRFFRQKTNPEVRPYRFIDDLTFVGVPLFVAGMALKGNKTMFRVNLKEEDGGKHNTQLLTDFKTGIDDYTQWFGPAMVVGLKLGGYKGRSDWPRLLASAGLSYAIMAGLVNGIKYTAKEMRPDGSTANSWPSGHTATAFVGATLLHKEYGLTRSPWWSVAGYGVATATGVMRVLNNRHWISDIMSGAGIGIMSGELGYAFCDLLFKGRGLLMGNLELDNGNPSFFSISMGLGLGGKDLAFEDMGREWNIRFRAATVVDAEAAYFFNKYVGVGGRLRVRAQSAKDFSNFAQNVAYEDRDAWRSLMPLYQEAYPDDYVATTTDTHRAQNEQTFLSKLGYGPNSAESAPVTNRYGIMKSDHITEFTGSLGVYFNLPLSDHFALGTKALMGRSMTQELDIDAHAEGNRKDISYTMSIDNRPDMKDADGTPAVRLDNLMYPNSTGETWTDDWEYLTIGARTSTSLGTGLSLTYRYRSNFSWRVFCDYDYTRKDFTARYDPFHFAQKALTAGANFLMDSALTSSEAHSGDGLGLGVREYKTRKYMNYVTLGLSFMVNL